MNVVMVLEKWWKVVGWASILSPGVTHAIANGISKVSLSLSNSSDLVFSFSRFALLSWTNYKYDTENSGFGFGHN